MAILKNEFSVPSVDGVHTLRGVIFRRDAGPYKACFHVAHGMVEHIGRYERFMTRLAEEGYIAFGYDHIGHGKTAQEKGDFGYIAHKNGWDVLARDVKQFADAAIAACDASSLPYYLMGHSMGSFIVRLAAKKYLSPDKLIIMGTGGPNPAAGAGLFLIALQKIFLGEKHISPLLDKLAFGGYNKRFEGEKQDASAWLTADRTVRDEYREDPFCKFRFTVSAMGDLIRLSRNANRPAAFRAYPSDMPILLISGAQDPVGGFGKGVRYVEKQLRKYGKNVTCLLYEGARHELLNDFTYEKTVEDILAFCENKKLGE